MKEAKSAPTKGRAKDGPPSRRTPEEQRAEIERVAREHGADLSEEGFDELLGKVARHKPASPK